MPQVKPFALDRWIDKHSPVCNAFMHHSCISPLSLTELQSLSPGDSATNGAHSNPGPLDDLLPLSYGPMRGSPKLRRSIADLYPSTSVTENDVLVTSGAISANFLILDSFCKPGDHVIVQYPTYGQLLEMPRRAGADVSVWRMHEEHGWSLDLDELKSMIQGNTKMIIINNPANPTGAILSKEMLQGIISIAKEHNIIVFNDEVFRPLFHSNEEVPPSLLELGYENSVVTGSMSKAYALPGIRVGWLAVHPSLRNTVLLHAEEERDYTSIAVSQVDDQIAAFALQPAVRTKILQRSAKVALRNIQVLEEWANKRPKHIRWTKPKGAGTAIVTILDNNGKPVDDEALAVDLAHEHGVLSPPAHACFGAEGLDDLKGGLRIGIVMKEGDLEEGLAGLGKLLSARGLQG